MSAPATLVSVNVGMPKDVPWQGRTVHTGVWKSAVSGPHRVRRLNIDGDGQGDRGGHGGEQRAVLVYQLDSYRHWRDHFGRDDFEYGQFGENFTVDGLSDTDVCVGDRYRIGSAEFEVTQPRVTCFRVGMRLGEPALPSLLVAHHRPGFYLRVLTEGVVRAGDDIVRTGRGPHELSVADIDALLYLPGRDLARLRDALDIPALSPGWQESFRDAWSTAADPAAGEPGWVGFRELEVVDVVPETEDVRSVYLAAADGTALPRPVPGQFLTLRLPRRSRAGAQLLAVRRSGGRALPDQRQARAARPREQLRRTRRSGRGRACRPRHLAVTSCSPGATRPVLLVSAGIGVTPVLAMLHDLAARRTERVVWWIHVARNAAQHAFVAEVHDLLGALPRGTGRIYYTAPDAGPPAAGIMVGRPTAATFAGLGIPADADAYVCGPAAFMTAVHDALAGLGIAPDPRAHRTVRGAACRQPWCRGRAAQGAAPAARPARTRPGHHLCAVRPDRRLVTGVRVACSNLPRHATYPPGGPAAPASATPARPQCSPASRRSRRHPSNLPRRATRSSAARCLPATSSSTCDASLNARGRVPRASVWCRSWRRRRGLRRTRPAAARTSTCRCHARSVVRTRATVCHVVPSVLTSRSYDDGRNVVTGPGGGGTFGAGAGGHS